MKLPSLDGDEQKAEMIRATEEERMRGDQAPLTQTFTGSNPDNLLSNAPGAWPKTNHSRTDSRGRPAGASQLSPR